MTGTGFPTTGTSFRATLGGVPLNNINLIDPYTFTATTPMHAAENNVPLVVTTDTGTGTLTGAFDYLNAIAVTPNTASNQSDSIWVDVKGVGFEALNFDTGPFVAADTHARVWLIDGTGGACTSATVCGSASYLPAGTGAFAAGAGPTAECLTPAVISSNDSSASSC